MAGAVNAYIYLVNTIASAYSDHNIAQRRLFPNGLRALKTELKQGITLTPLRHSTSARRAAIRITTRAAFTKSPDMLPPRYKPASQRRRTPYRASDPDPAVPNSPGRRGFFYGAYIFN